MSSFIPSAGENQNNGLDAQFLRKALNLQNQSGQESTTVSDLASERTDIPDRANQDSEDSQGTTASELIQEGEGDSDQQTIETGRSQDASVEGDGFVSLNVGGEQQFSRSVSLSVDDQGNVQDDITGGQVQTESTNENGETQVENLQLSDDQQTIESQETTEAGFSGNISDTLAQGESVEFQAEVTASNGNTQTVSFQATRSDTDQVEISAQDPNSGDTALQANVNFNDEGNVQSVDVQQNDSGTQGLTVSDGSGGSTEISGENLNFSNLSLQEGESSADAETNGNAEGQLQSLSVSNGQVQGEFSNGQTRNFGEIATAQFENADQLEESSSGTFSATEESGEANFSQDAELSSGQLESQNSENTNQIVNDLLSDSNVSGGNRQAILGSAIDLFG